MNRRHVPIMRMFVATVTNSDGSSFTAVIHGATPDEAERAYLAEHPNATRIVVRSELR